MRKQIFKILAASCVLVWGFLSATAQTMPDVLTLDRAGERLIERNLTLEVARLGVSAAEQARLFARLRPRPTLNVSTENLRIAGETPFNRLYEASAVVTQPIPLGGQTRAKTEVADRAVVLAEARLEGVLRIRLSEMRRIFFEVLLAQERLKIEDENSRNFDDFLSISELRLKEGDISPGEVMKLRLERTRYISAVADARLSLRQGKIRLLELLGDTDFSRIERLELRETLDFQDYNVSLTALQQSGLQNRPEIRIAEAEFLRAESVFKLERARSKGEIEPYAGYRRVGVDNTVLTGVNIPLPFGDRNQPAIAQSQADQNIAAATLLQTKNSTAAAGSDGRFAGNDNRR